jgi:hypothetical protein
MDDNDIKDCVIRLEEQMKFMSEKIVSIHGILKVGPKKYASKWVETTMKGIIGTILLAFLGALIALVLTPTTGLIVYNLIKHYV